MGNRYVVKAKEYKVQDGDTLASLASTAGITVSELTKFNWGTDVPKEINKFLTSQVGCFKVSADRKSYLFTGKEDPGIIYIPEDFPEETGHTDSTYTITVKPVNRKTFIPSKCIVEFRPLTSYKGEFGFDWLRLGDIGEHKYYDILDGGFKSSSAADTAGMTKAEAINMIKTSRYYHGFKTDIGGSSPVNYRVPWLNLYSQTTPGKPTPPTKAELRILTTIEDEEPLVIELDYNKNLFQIDKEVLSDKAVGKKRISNETITITCLEKFDTSQEINVLAKPKGWKDGSPIPLAGRIIVGANGDGSRKRAKFVLVEVMTDIDGRSPVKGTFSKAEITGLRNSLHQAYVHPIMEHGPPLNLTAIDHFRIQLEPVSNTLIYGDYIYKATTPPNPDYHDGQIYQDFNWQTSEVFEFLKTEFFKDAKVKAKFEHHFPVFAFGVKSYFDGVKGTVDGQIQDIGKKNLIVFPERGSHVLSHEVLHGLGLYHTHKDINNDGSMPPFEENRKFTFDKYETNNIMSYEDGSVDTAKKISTWHWQWEIIRSNT